MSQIVIVPLDGSLCAIHALPFARAAARAFAGRLVLLRVLPRERPWQQPAAVEAVRAELDGLVGMLGREGIEAEAEVAWGLPAPTIKAAAQERRADLIVMASHQRHGLDRWLHGSVTETVLHGTRVPVLIVPHEGAHVPSYGAPLRVLVPLDGSVFSEVALDTVRRTAAARPLDVLLVQVVRLRVVSLGGLTATAVDPEAEQREAEAYLARVAQGLRAEGVTVHTRVILGQRDVAGELLDLADAEAIGTIVMATHGRGALAHLALGSVSTAVLENSPIPVLLVPGQMGAPPTVAGEARSVEAAALS